MLVGDDSEDWGLLPIYTAGSKLAAEVPEPIMRQHILGQTSALHMDTDPSNGMVQYDTDGKLFHPYTIWK